MDEASIIADINRAIDETKAIIGKAREVLGPPPHRPITFSTWEKFTLFDIWRENLPPKESQLPIDELKKMYQLRSGVDMQGVSSLNMVLLAGRKPKNVQELGEFERVVRLRVGAMESELERYSAEGAAALAEGVGPTTPSASRLLELIEKTKQIGKRVQAMTDDVVQARKAFSTSNIALDLFRQRQKPKESQAPKASDPAPQPKETPSAPQVVDPKSEPKLESKGPQPEAKELFEEQKEPLMEEETKAGPESYGRGYEAGFRPVRQTLADVLEESFTEESPFI